MISSMTGFGRGHATVDGVTASVEMRSVNKRHCKVSVRVPNALEDHEADVQSFVKETFERGKFNVYVQLGKADESVIPIEVDPEAAEQYGQLLKNLCAAADIDDSVRLDHLLEFSDVFTTVEDESDVGEEAWAAAQQGLREAADQLQAMRRDEGQALRNDLEDRIDAIGEGLDVIEEQAPERVEEQRERLEERLSELVEDERIDPDRLETEIAILADKLDITEECVRLRSHLNLFREALENDEPVGRKLKFITQEIHREVNTMGSKANDPVITREVVQMKEDIEKIREQVQNVE